MRFLSLHTYGTNLQKFLASPISFLSPQEFRWPYILVAVIFPALFFLIFKPFGIFNTSGTLLHNAVIAGYGLVSGVMAFLFFIVFPAFAKSFFSSFNIGKAVLYFTVFFLMLSVANYVYKTSWCGEGSYSWCGFMVVFKRTLLIGALPLILLIIWENNRKLKNRLSVTIPTQDASSINPQGWTIYSENGKEMIRISSNQLLFIESADNYVEIYYQQEQRVEKKLLRTTLSKVTEVIDAPSVIRCHRSFIVNLQHVIHAAGNARGLSLEVSGISQKVPVSRRYVALVSDQLNLS